jgi:hypothetical protein
VGVGEFTIHHSNIHNSPFTIHNSPFKHSQFTIKGKLAFAKKNTSIFKLAHFQIFKLLHHHISQSANQIGTLKKGGGASANHHIS